MSGEEEQKAAPSQVSGQLKVSLEYGLWSGEIHRRERS